MTAVLAAAAIVCGCDCASSRARSPDGCVEPRLCYDGPPGTAGVGICVEGVAPCEEGRLLDCSGQVLPAKEACNGLDDDCDGVADGDSCNFECVGVGCEREWGSLLPGLEIGPSGGLALEFPGDSEVAVLWVLERNAGTVAKVDTRAREVVARYQVVPLDYCAVEEAPVFVQTDIDGSVYVSTASYQAAGPGRVLSIAYDDCPDLDGDGGVETSSGPDDVLPFLEDECIRWHFVTDEENYGLPLAFERAARRGGPASVLWIGGSRSGRVWAVDPRTGEPTGAEIALGRAEGDVPERMAFDGSGFLQASSAPQTLDVIDTADLDSDRHRYPIGPGGGEPMVQDHRGHLWLEGMLRSFDAEKGEWSWPSLFDAALDFAGPLPYGMVVASTGVLFGTTITDADGWHLDSPVLVTYDIDADVFEVRLDTPLDWSSFALDVDGMIWQLLPGGTCGGNICCGLADERLDAFVIDPWTGDRDVAIAGELSGSALVWDNPTGVVPLDLRMEPASAVYTFEGCSRDGGQGTEWTSLEWDAVLPDSTSVTLEVADSGVPSPPPDQRWKEAHVAPPDAAPVWLLDSGIGDLPFLHVRVTLTTVPDAPPAERATPELLWVGVRWGCHGQPE